jgi:hypothetical protein
MKTITDARYYSTAMGAADNGATSGSSRISAILQDIGIPNTDAELKAYRLGSYLKQNVRPANSNKAAFVASLAGLGLYPNYHDGNPADYIENLDAILIALENRLLEKFDAALNLGSITNVNNRNRISELNRWLIKQIGEDIYQLDAMVDDYKDINVNMNTTILWTDILANITQAEPQKASVLMANFDPHSIKQEGGIARA